MGKLLKFKKPSFKFGLSNTTIKSKLKLKLLPIILLLLISISLIGYNFSKNYIISAEEDFLSFNAKLASNQANNVFMSDMDMVKLIASTPLLSDSSVSLKDKLAYLNSLHNREDYQIVGIANTRGSITYDNGMVEDISNEDYFKYPMDGSTYISEPFKSTKDPNLSVMSYSAPIKKNDTIVGVLVLIKTSSEFSTLIESLHYGETGSAYILDSEGTIVAHDDIQIVRNEINSIELSKKDKDLEDLAAIDKKMIAGEQGVDSYTYKGVENYIAYHPIGSTGWSIACYVEKDEVLSIIHKLQLIFIGILILSTVIIILVINMVSRSISRPIVDVKNDLEHLKDGDFSSDLNTSYLNDKSEIGVMYNALRNTKSNVGTIINIVKENSMDIGDHASNLTAVSEELSSIISDVSNSIEEVSKGSSKQADDLTNISLDMNDFGEIVSDLNNDIGSIKEKSEIINLKAKTSSKELLTLESTIKRFNENFTVFSSTLSKTNKDIKKVNNMTDIINNIASKTNLLALNAAIEAARAGESGRGFAVVADEIRKLAEMSQKSSQDIYDTVSNIIKNTDDIQVKTTEMTQDVEVQNSVLSETILVFENILKEIQEIIPQIDNAHTSFKDIDTRKETILERVETLSAISEEIASTTETVANASQGLNIASSEVLSSAQELNTITCNLNENMNKFKV